MSVKKSKSDLLLTERALRDIAEIERHSISEWGKKTAARYISDIEAALLLLQVDSELLRAEEEPHPELRFFSSGEQAPAGLRCPAECNLSAHSTQNASTNCTLSSYSLAHNSPAIVLHTLVFGFLADVFSEPFAVRANAPNR